jgi:MoxR-like ATPase
LSSTTGSKKVSIQPILNAAEIQELQKLVREVNINDDLVAYVSELVRATRPETTAMIM